MAGGDEEPEVLPRRLAQSEPGQQDFFPADFLELERARIESFDRRTEVARAAVEADRESEQQLFKYHMKRLDNDEAQGVREHRFASRFLWSLLVIGVVGGALLMWMAFFGTPAQSALAMQMLITFGKLASGAGLFVLARQIWRYLFRRTIATSDEAE